MLTSNLRMSTPHQSSSESEIPFELTTLVDANHYSKWIFQSVQSYMGERILELGAGIGNMTQWLPKRDLLVITETVPFLMNYLQNRIGPHPRTVFKKIDLDLSFASQVKEYNVDTIVSFNVLEHIKDDVAAIREQIQVLRESDARTPKRLIIFVPAHDFAFGSFDRIFEHFRRYTDVGLRKIVSEIDPKLEVKTFYFNLLTLPGWVFASRVTQSTRFNPVQLKIVNFLIPFWRPIDWVLHHLFRIPLGQSVVAVVKIP